MPPFTRAWTQVPLQAVAESSGGQHAPACGKRLRTSPSRRPRALSVTTQRITQADSKEQAHLTFNTGLVSMSCNKAAPFSSRLSANWGISCAQRAKRSRDCSTQNKFDCVLQANASYLGLRISFLFSLRCTHGRRHSNWQSCCIQMQTQSRRKTCKIPAQPASLATFRWANR